MDYTEICDKIWLYSKYYGDMVATAIRLKDEGESYASLLVLFNSIELIFKSVRGSDSHKFVDDVEWLYNKQLLSKDEYDFINSENGIRLLRNKMNHKDFYEYCAEIDDIAYPFADRETWRVLCERILHKLRDIQIIINC